MDDYIGTYGEPVDYSRVGLTGAAIRKIYGTIERVSDAKHVESGVDWAVSIIVDAIMQRRREFQDYSGSDMWDRAWEVAKTFRDELATYEKSLMREGHEKAELWGLLEKRALSLAKRITMTPDNVPGKGKK